MCRGWCFPLARPHFVSFSVELDIVWVPYNNPNCYVNTSLECAPGVDVAALALESVIYRYVSFVRKCAGHDYCVALNLLLCPHQVSHVH